MFWGAPLQSTHSKRGIWSLFRENAPPSESAPRLPPRKFFRAPRRQVVRLRGPKDQRLSGHASGSRVVSEVPRLGVVGRAKKMFGACGAS